MLKKSKFSLKLILLLLLISKLAMALEEPEFVIIKSFSEYEIRKYKDRLAVQVEYSNNDRGFQYLFNYISGRILMRKK